MQRKISRRALVKSGLIAGAMIPAMGLLSESAAAAGLPRSIQGSHRAGLGVHHRRQESECSRESDLQAQSEVRHLRAIPRKAGRYQRRLQYFRRQERARGRLVQGLGAEAGGLSRRADAFHRPRHP